MIDVIICVYVDEYFNVYWGFYFLLNFVMEKYESVCGVVVKFLNVVFEDEIIFNLGIIEGINMVVYVWVVLWM